MSSTGGRLSSLKRDLSSLKSKRERTNSKIKELQVEMKLIDEKIKTLEEELKAEQKRCERTAPTINDTISNVILSVSSLMSAQNSNSSGSSNNQIRSPSSTQTDPNTSNFSSNSSSDRAPTPNDVLPPTHSSAPPETYVSNHNVPPNRNPFVSRFEPLSGRSAAPLYNQPAHSNHFNQTNQNHRPTYESQCLVSTSYSQFPAGRWSSDKNVRSSSYNQVNPIRINTNTMTTVPNHQQPQQKHPPHQQHQPSYSSVANYSRSGAESSLPVLSDRPERCRSSSSSNDQLEVNEPEKITFQDLPLAFEECVTIIEPRLIQNSDHYFIKMSDIYPYLKKYNIVLRFCIYKSKKRFQSDRVARAVTIAINDNCVPLTKNSSKAIKCPITIGGFCVLETNKITIDLPLNNTRIYGCGVYAMKKLPIGTTLNRLKLVNYTRPESLTLDIIRKKFSSNSDIVSESIKVPLTCPITKRRLLIPALGCKCEHVSCFEAQVFLEMNLNKDEWICPICNRPIGPEELIRDGLTSKILTELEAKCTQVEFFVDGSYKQVDDNPIESSSVPGKKSVDIVCIDLSDEDSDEPAASVSAGHSDFPSLPAIQTRSTHYYDEDTEVEGEDSDHCQPASAPDTGSCFSVSDPDFSLRSTNTTLSIASSLTHHNLLFTTPEHITNHIPNFNIDMHDEETRKRKKGSSNHKSSTAKKKKTSRTESKRSKKNTF